MSYEVNNLYNTMECLELSDKMQNSVNEIIIYCTGLYIKLSNDRKEILDIDKHLDESNFKNVAKNYFNYSMKLLTDGIKLDLFEAIMQNYYESKMLSLVSNKSTYEEHTLDCVRLQMLFVLYSSKLLYLDEKDEYLYLTSQFASNEIFDEYIYTKFYYI